jgi:adenylate cyclase
MTYYTDWAFFWSDNPRTIEQVFALAQRSVTLNDFVPVAHRLLGLTYLHRKQHDQAIAEVEWAIVLNPNDAENYLFLGTILFFAGRPEEAIGMIEKAMRLNPHYPPVYLSNLGFAYLVAGRYEEALVPLKKALTLVPNYAPVHNGLAGCYAELGRLEEARAEVAEVRRITPTASLEGYRQMLPYKDPTVLERRLAALRKAGLK